MLKDDTLEHRLFRVPFSGWMLKSYYYPKMCYYEWCPMFGTWETGARRNVPVALRKKAKKWYSIGARLGWAYFHVVLEQE